MMGFPYFSKSQKVIYHLHSGESVCKGVTEQTWSTENESVSQNRLPCRRQTTKVKLSTGSAWHKQLGNSGISAACNLSHKSPLWFTACTQRSLGLWLDDVDSSSQDFLICIGNVKIYLWLSYMTFFLIKWYLLSEFLLLSPCHWFLPFWNLLSYRIPTYSKSNNQFHVDIISCISSSGCFYFPV